MERKRGGIRDCEMEASVLNPLSMTAHWALGQELSVPRYTLTFPCSWQQYMYKSSMNRLHYTTTQPTIILRYQAVVRKISLKTVNNPWHASNMKTIVMVPFHLFNICNSVSPILTSVILFLQQCSQCCTCTCLLKGKRFWARVRKQSKCDVS